jgi:hypothetical protein
MAAKPTITPGILRRKIREVLNMAPGYGKTEAMLLEFVNELTGGGVTADLLKQGLEWNLSNEYVRSAVNADTDELEWKITKHGIAHEEIT